MLLLWLLQGLLADLRLLLHRLRSRRLLALRWKLGLLHRGWNAHALLHGITYRSSGL